MRKIATLLILCFMPICLFAQTYKMYQTRNYHNQLRLNTATGEVLQVQDDGQSWKICDAVEDGGEIDNRFCLYETQNMWTFIMRFDSKWYTKICNDESFKVSGHFRLQPYGDGTRKLIWINEFTKNGYHRKATIDKVKDGEVSLT